MESVGDKIFNLPTDFDFCGPDLVVVTDRDGARWKFNNEMRALRMFEVAASYGLESQIFQHLLDLWASFGSGNEVQVARAICSLLVHRNYGASHEHGFNPSFGQVIADVFP